MTVNGGVAVGTGTWPGIVPGQHGVAGAGAFARGGRPLDPFEEPWPHGAITGAGAVSPLRGPPVEGGTHASSVPGAGSALPCIWADVSYGVSRSTAGQIADSMISQLSKTGKGEAQDLEGLDRELRVAGKRLRWLAGTAKKGLAAMHEVLTNVIHAKLGKNATLADLAEVAEKCDLLASCRKSWGNWLREMKPSEGAPAEKDWLILKDGLGLP